MNEHHIGYRVRQILNSQLSLDPERSARLAAARERAIRHQRAEARRPALALAGIAGSRLVQSNFLIWRIALPVLILAVGLLAISKWQQSQAQLEIEEIDAALLTGDLPIDAYLDRGFDAWLKRSLR